MIVSYLHRPLLFDQSVRSRKLGTSLIVGFNYAYDNEGNKFYEQKLHELNHSQAYTSDAVYRLIDS